MDLAYHSCIQSEGIHSFIHSFIALASSLGVRYTYQRCMSQTTLHTAACQPHMRLKESACMLPALMPAFSPCSHSSRGQPSMSALPPRPCLCPWLHLSAAPALPTDATETLPGTMAAQRLAVDGWTAPGRACRPRSRTAGLLLVSFFLHVSELSC